MALLSTWVALSAAFLFVPFLGLNSKDDNNIRLGIYITVGIIGAYVGAKWANAVIIYSTAFLGSYGFVRGISLYVGGFINEL